MNKIPTVTKLLKLLDKPALLGWANRIGLDGVSLEEHRFKSQSRGNNWHDEIEKAIRLGKEIDDPEMRKKFHWFFKDVEFLDCEKDVMCDKWKGRLDVRFRKGDTTYLCDFKSNVKGVYLENKLQLVAYSEIEPSDRLGIISIPDFKFHRVDIPDRKPYVNILNALSDIYKNKQLI